MPLPMIRRSVVVALAVLLVSSVMFAAVSPSRADAPVDIVILGGESAVSASVEAHLKTCTTGTVNRQAGLNRYQTATAISKAAFASASHAYIATGLNFPDALAGGPPAAISGQPVLLVNDAVPSSTLIELSRLGVSSITVLGGSAVVPNSVVASLNALVPTSRIAGSDRYATAAAIVQAKFATADTVYVATGLNFPDALAGVPAAAGDTAPILLVKPDSIPAATATQLNRLNPTTIKVLGGTAVISSNVANALEGYASSVIRLSGSDRYATATAISKHAFPGGASRIYIATGLNYPDALAGGPAAGANDAPILLVRTDSIPGATKSEIQRITGTPCAPTPPPPVLAEGSGVGDDVETVALPNVPVVVEFSHGGSSNFAVWSLDSGFSNIDLLVNEIGPYTGTRPMQFDSGEPVSGLEIIADGTWSYQIRRLSDEPEQSCRVNGSGDSVIRLNEFKAGSGTATLTHDGSSNFYIWAWSTSDRDLLVNEIGPYTGTVLVTVGHNTWDIGADGAWSVSC
jgi:putative cell wall-binding protein